MTLFQGNLLSAVIEIMEYYYILVQSIQNPSLTLMAIFLIKVDYNQDLCKDHRYSAFSENLRSRPITLTLKLQRIFILSPAHIPIVRGYCNRIG